MKVAMKFSGIDDLKAVLKTCPQELRGNVFGLAMRKAAKPIVKAARANAAANKDSGLLAKSFGVNVRVVKKTESGPAAFAKFRVLKGKGREVIRVRKSGGKYYKMYADAAKYAHLVEFGTPHSAAKPFVRPAISSQSRNATQELAKGIAEGIPKVIARAKKGKK